MTHLRFLLALLLATPLIAAEPFTPRDAATIHDISSPRVAPDGEAIIYELSSADLETSSYDTDIWMVRGKPFRLAATRHSESSPAWSPDGKLVAFLSDRSDSEQVWLIRPDGGEAWQLTHAPESVNGFRWLGNDRIVFVSRDAKSADMKERSERKDDAYVVGERRGRHLYSVDLDSGEIRKLTSGELTVFDFDASPDGTTVVYASAPAISLEGLFATDLYRLSVDDGSVDPLVVRDGRDSSPRISPDGRFVAFVTHGGSLHWNRQMRLAVVPLAGEEPIVVSEEYSRTPNDFRWMPDSRTLYFQGPLDTEAEVFRVDRDGSGFRQVTDLGGVVTDLDVGSDGTMAFVYEDLGTPAELYDASSHKLTNHNEAFADRQLGETRIVEWTNPKDGLRIEGLLTLPIGYERGTKVPLITFVHGGPASHFDQRYVGYLGTIYPVHSYAARGFAVLRPNPRGTGSYPEAFRKGNQADWGGMDYLDIQSGIDMLIEEGIADPERLGMMGWSYGGFMTAWTITQTDRFVAVSIGAPVVDLLSFHGTTDIPGFIPSYFDSTPWANPDLHRLHSPMWQIANATTPALIQHGNNDDRVPLSQGQMLYRALEELDVPVVMVVYPRTPHTPREPLLRIDAANRNLWWFEKWLMGKDGTYEEWLGERE